MLIGAPGARPVRQLGDGEPRLAHRRVHRQRLAALVAVSAIPRPEPEQAGVEPERGFDNYTLERVVTTLVVACPHALGLAIPLVIAISTTLSARNGILVRDRLALEEARRLDVVVFDKTGTLTRGEQGLVDLAVVDGLAEWEALALAAAVEGDSEHPLTRAIVGAARERGVEPPPAAGFGALPGRDDQEG